MTQVNKKPRTPRQAAARRGEIDRRLNADLFRALSDPTRLVLLACLAKCDRACSVGEVAECCSVDLSVVSRHLALMARAGVLEVRKEGRTVLYRVRAREMVEGLRALADALERCAPDCAARGTGCCGNKSG